MVRAGRAVHEVPLAQRSLFSFDDQQRLAGEHEEILLIVLAVVHGHRLAGRENSQVDPELREVRLALEPLEFAVVAAALEVDPRRIESVEDEPAFALGDESVLGGLERRLRDHQAADLRSSASSLKTTFSSVGENSRISAMPRLRNQLQRSSTSTSGAEAPEVTPTVSMPSSQRSSSSRLLSIKCAGNPADRATSTRRCEFELLAEPSTSSSCTCGRSSLTAR